MYNEIIEKKPAAKKPAAKKKAAAKKETAEMVASAEEAAEKAASVKAAAGKAATAVTKRSYSFPFFSLNRFKPQLDFCLKKYILFCNFFYKFVFVFTKNISRSKIGR